MKKNGKRDLTIDDVDRIADARWKCLVVDVQVKHLVEATQNMRGIDERVMVLVYAVEASVNEMWSVMQEVSRKLK